MLYLKRKIDAFLTEWKANSNRKPLIVKGSKQVVKTESIRRFGGGFEHPCGYEMPFCPVTKPRSPV